MKLTSNNMPQFPLYIVSKGRWEGRKTAKALIRQNVPFRIVVEAQEADHYAEVLGRERVLILDPQFQKDYDTFDNLGDSKSKGPGAARNFVWQHSMDLGFDFHWVMDDNISDFYRLDDNLKVPVTCGSAWRAMEEFVLRYENIAMAGPNYAMFVPRKAKVKAFIMNTRIYSCNLIRNSVPFRWRGRYNEDTDLSLRMLKSGWCTVQFNAFLQNKLPTQTVKGGNTEEFYAHEGTLAKSKMQVAMHPDISTLVKKYGRWHHDVDYTVFRNQGLIRRKDVTFSEKANEFGMTYNPSAT